MAATMKLSLTFVVLLLSGLMVVFGDARDAKVDCDAIRCIQGGYITCENHKEAIQVCTCVCAPKNGKRCVLHLNDGSKQNCTKTNY